MKKLDIRTGAFGLLAAVLVALSGCGTPSQDDQREKEYLPRFEAAMEAHRYCDAVGIVADRFNYTEMGNIQERAAQRFTEWMARNEVAKTGCLREQWPAKEAKLKAAIQSVRAQQALYADMDRLTVTAVAGSLRNDGRGLCCLLDVVAKNGSSQAVSGFTLSAHPADDNAVTATIGPLDGPLSPGETRQITGFFGRLDDYHVMQGGNIPAISLYATTLELADSRPVKLADWRNQYPEYLFDEQTQALEKRLAAESPFH